MIRQQSPTSLRAKQQNQKIERLYNSISSWSMQKPAQSLERKKRGGKMAGDGCLPLFETRRAKGIIFYRVFAVSVFVCIFLIWVYRLSHIPNERDHQNGRLTLWVWIGLFAAELWFGFYWIVTQAVRWNRVHRQTFRNRLSQRWAILSPGVTVILNWIVWLHRIY